MQSITIGFDKSEQQVESSILCGVLKSMLTLNEASSGVKEG